MAKNGEADRCAKMTKLAKRGKMVKPVEGARGVKYVKIGWAENGPEW